MPVSNEYLDYVLEQLASLGQVRARRMFGGVGLYCDEQFFGLIADDDTLYLRVDDTNRSDYTTRGMAPFRPYADKPQLSMSYYATPADVLEDAMELAVWARRSVVAARAAASARPSARRSHRGR